VLPLCKAFVLFRAIQARYKSDDEAPTLEDEDIIENGTDDLKREISKVLARFKQGRARRACPEHGQKDRDRR
jgi:hypothetical protein